MVAKAAEEATSQFWAQQTVVCGIGRKYLWLFI
jgi:hypothetical protein